MKFNKIALAISLTLMLAFFLPTASALAVNVQSQSVNVRTNTVHFLINHNVPMSARLIIVRNPATLATRNISAPIVRPMTQPTTSQTISQSTPQTISQSTPQTISQPTPQTISQPTPQTISQPTPQTISQPTPQTISQPTPQPVSPSTGSQVHRLSESELLMINLVNQERQKAGVAPLIIDNQLSRVARIKSEDMMANRFFSHTSPTYGSPFQMMRTFGINFRAAGENIARTSSVANAHNGLMNSEGHRRNILNPGFTHIGIGIAGGRYYTQMFITR